MEETTETIVDEKKSDSTTLQKETVDATTKVEETVKTDDVKKEEIKESILEGLEETEGDERGKFSYKIGDSIYFGNTEKEVVNKALKGIEEKDSLIKKLRVAEKVKVPEKTEVEAEPFVVIPNDTDVYVKHLQEQSSKAGINTDMLQWTDADWTTYEDDNAVRPWKIAELRQQVKAVIDKANELTDRDMIVATVAVNNNRILEQATETVREMLQEAGIDLDKFDYQAAVDKAMERKDKSGRIRAGAIEAEAAKQIFKIKNSTTPIKKDLTAVIDKGKEAKLGLKKETNGQKLKADDDDTHLSFDELRRVEMKKVARVSAVEI